MNAPEHMHFEIGGFGPSGCELTYDGVSLQYLSPSSWPIAPPDSEVSIPVTPEDWEEFSRELDRIGVWDWKRQYNSDVLDGTQWVLKIHWQTRRLNVYGSNCYPESDGSPSEACELTPTFDRLLKALSRLAGGRSMD